MLNHSPSFTRLDTCWITWKYNLLKKMGTHQYTEDADTYTIWFYDDPEVHVCTLWKTGAPDSIKSSYCGCPYDCYSDIQNAINVAEFESIYKATANQRLSIKTMDGRPTFLPSLFPAGIFVNITGAGDDTGYGDGQLFTLSSTAVETKYIEFRMKDWVYLAGGKVNYANAVLGDYLDFTFYAPATTVTPNANNTGNCNVVSSVIVVPAADDGAYDVDYATAVPVPVGTEETYPNGYWDWSSPNTGKGVVVPCAGDGYYNLYTIPINLCKLVTKMPLIGSGSHDLLIPAIKPKKMLPHWKGKFSMYNSTEKTLNVIWYLVTGRAKTC